MRQVFQEITTRIDAMQLRERGLLLLAGTAVLVFLVDSFGFQPTFKLQKAQTTAILNVQQQLSIVRERSALLTSHTGKNQSLWRNELQDELSGLDHRLHSEIGGLLAPDQAIEVLQQVLAQEKGLNLIEVDAISTPLNNLDVSQQDNNLISGVGRYGLRLELEGSYLAILNYLLALEALPWKFFWEGIEFEVINYPDARVTLNIYTLGLLKG